MKKFLIIFLILLIPTIAFAAPSATVKNTIYSKPEIAFDLYNIQEGFVFDIEGYELVEALTIIIDKPYEEVVWYFNMETKSDDQFKVVLMDDSLFMRDGHVLEDGGISVDFSSVPEDEYLMLIFRQKIFDF